MRYNAKYWIEKLELLPHPEGGYFKEIYRGKEQIKKSSLPERFNGDRNHSTAIYYLLEKGDFSCFHRIKSDEIWHHYDGGVINIYILENMEIKQLKLGLNLEAGENPVCVVPKNKWFAAELSKDSSFALAGCTVAPGFDFQDFEIANAKQVESYFAQRPDLIERLTK